MDVVDLRRRLAWPRGTASRARVAAEVGARADVFHHPSQIDAGWRAVGLDAVSAGIAAVPCALALEQATAATALLVVVTWPIALASTGEYGILLREPARRRQAAVAAAAVRMLAACALLSLVVPALSLAAMVVTTAAVALVTAAGRRTFESGLTGCPGVHAWTTALVRGPAGEVARLAHQVAGDRHPPFTVAAVQVTHGRLPGDDGVAGIPTVDIREDPVDAAIRLGVDALVLVGPQDEPSCDVRRCVWRLESHGIDTLMVPIAADIAAPSVTTVGDTGLPLLAFHARHVGAEVGFGKALLDKLLALVCIVLLSPVILATALAVKLTSRGPVLFRQVRVGIGGREFQMLKFRTMQVDAEARRAELEGLNKHSGGTLFKIEDDPRVTPVGRFLRRYSLDELPQLVNILKGEMALVGPRPPLPEEVAQYPVDAHRRFLVRPGLTGLWQVSGRSDLDPELGAQLDTHYVEQWSIGMDVHILARTPKAVISGKGAY